MPVPPHVSEASNRPAGDTVSQPVPATGDAIRPPTYHSGTIPSAQATAFRVPAAAEAVVGATPAGVGAPDAGSSGYVSEVSAIVAAPEMIASQKASRLWAVFTAVGRPPIVVNDLPPGIHPGTLLIDDDRNVGVLPGNMEATERDLEELYCSAYKENQEARTLA
jgi:hypothetical protein